MRRKDQISPARDTRRCPIVTGVVRKVGLALVAVLALVWLPQQSNSAEFDSSTPPGGQFRAYWVDAFGDDLFDAPRIDAIVASTKAAHLNAIVVQAVRRGDCFCNRASVPRTEQPGLAPSPFDPLPVSYTHLTLPTIYSV